MDRAVTDKLAETAGSGSADANGAILDTTTLDVLFRTARSQNGWLDRDIDESVLCKVWDLAKWGPTSANSSPMRITFLRSKAAKETLLPHLDPSNKRKSMTAPAVAIIGADHVFYEKMTMLFPHNPGAADRFRGTENRERAETTAFRNSSLQGAYFMIAARAYGLDCGPISGFDAKGVDRSFWAGTKVQTNFICNLGYGDPSYLFPRLPRLSFQEACSII